MTPDEALKNILSGVSAVAASEHVPLLAAQGRIAAKDIYSPASLPNFDNSAMDGFCIHADDLGRTLPLRLRLLGEIRAGDVPEVPLQPGHAMRIMTGAMVPAGAAAVVIDESAEIGGGGVTIGRTVAAGKNIRRTGEDVEIGTILVTAGSTLSTRHLALLASAGISQVEVCRRPRVGILSTGNELLEPGMAAGKGRIVEVNSYFLKSMLEFTGAQVTDFGIAPDNLGVLSRIFAGIGDLDLMVTSGGVAGSDADLVAAALAEAGGRSTVCSLKLRPGKPVGFGWQGHCRTLHLPGNPMAALVTAYLFMLPLARLLGGAEPRPQSSATRTASAFHHVPGKTEFVPVRIAGADGNGVALVEMLGKGGSARLLPLAMADGLAEIPASRGSLEAGEFISFHPFRQMGLG